MDVVAYVVNGQLDLAVVDLGRGGLIEVHKALSMKGVVHLCGEPLLHEESHLALANHDLVKVTHHLKHLGSSSHLKMDRVRDESASLRELIVRDILIVVHDSKQENS